MITRPPSIKDVARLAGVSTATVSRTLNNLSSVSPETRELVMAAAGEVGYRFNQVARNLRRRQSGAIAVLVPNLGNPFFSDILAGIESVMTQSSINVLVLDTYGLSAQSADIADYLSSHRADGIICLDGSLDPGTFVTQHNSGVLPLVFACEWPAAGNICSVRADNIRGAQLAIQHLVDLGHTRIGHAEGPAANVLTIERCRATIETLRENKLAVEPDWFFKGDFSLESGAAAARQWLAIDTPPSAVFCASDLMAIGMISELNANGIAVPDDISVVGFDDIDISRYFVPALTTIRQPTGQLGVVAATTLLQQLSAEGCADSPALLDVELIVRASTARLTPGS